MVEIEKQFEQAMMELCKDIQVVLHRPAMLHRMINKHGALDAAKMIINGDITDTFKKLYEINRKDLTIEYLVCKNKKYHKLFDIKEINIACERIGYNIHEPQYWITVHWPALEGGTVEFRHIYLKDLHEKLGNDVNIGDIVLIYESKGGPIEKNNPVKRREGKLGIVSIGEVCEKMTEYQQHETQYLDREAMHWKWIIRTDNHKNEGFVDLDKINQVLGYSPKYNFHGFGDSHSGLKKINKEEYSKLHSLFMQNIIVNEPICKYGSGGEGEAHKRLKEYVAANPSAVFNESDITHLHTEWPYPTRDRADIILKDKEDKWIAVEIEVSQFKGQIDGTCQAVKYQYMSCIVNNVPFSQSRSALIAYEIGPEIKKLCADHGVECYVVQRATVDQWYDSQH